MLMLGLRSARPVTIVLALLLASPCACKRPSGSPSPDAAVISAAVDAGTGSRASDQPSKDASPPTIESVRLFILDIDRALQSRDATALSKFARFPLPIQYYEYGLDNGIEATTLDTPTTALKKHDLWDLPRTFLTVAKTSAPQRGLPKCSRPNYDGDPRPEDWQRGRPAIEIHGKSATITLEGDGSCRIGPSRVVWRLEDISNSDWILVRVDSDP
jgi:hypothetical protein